MNPHGFGTFPMAMEETKGGARTLDKPVPEPLLELNDEPGEEDVRFHEMVSCQVKGAVRTFEWKLDSVRKERESVIDIIESIVKDVFEPKRGERQHGPTVPVGIKQYGS